MNLFERGAAIILITLIVIALSGCIEPAAIQPQPQAQVPGAQVLPIPITGSYIANGSINSDKLATNVIPYNVTVNTTGGNILGATIFTPLYNNGSITVNRTSFIVTQWSGEIGVNGTYKSYMQITLGGVNMTSSPAIAVSNNNATYPVLDTRTIVVYNTSVGAGTYVIVPYVNGSDSNASVTFGKNILITTAYPHS